MSSLKVWIRGRLDTPEKARTVLSNIALGGGAVGGILTIIAVLVAHA